MRITRTLSIVIAVAALAAPAAHARPADVPAVQADMHASVAQAASQAAQQRPPGHAGQADWNAAPRPVVPQPVSEAPVADGGGVAWTTIGLGVLASLLAIGGASALHSRRSHPRLRPTV